VTATATLGTSSANTTIQFNPPIASSIDVPSTVSGGSTTPITVHVSGYPVPGGTLSVTSSNTSVLSSATVTQSGSVYTGTVTAASVTTATTVTLSVTSGGATVTANVTVEPCSVSPSTPSVPSEDDVWVEDSWPDWAVTAEDENQTDPWDSSQHATGSYSLNSGLAEGWHGIGFGSDMFGPIFGPDETFVTYVLINNCAAAPTTLSIGISLSYMVYPTPPGGAFIFYWGDGSVVVDSGAIRVGDMPPTGQWVRLEIPLSMLAAGGRLNSVSLQTYGGQVWWDHIGTAAGPAPARISDATVPASPQPYGSALTWTISALGGTPPIQYRFERLDGSTWSTVQAYSSTNTYTWTPSAGDVGAHSVRVSVRNYGATADSEDSRTYPITITSPGGMLRAPRRASDPIVLSIGARYVAVESSPGDARRYSFYTPSLNLLSETLLTTASAPTPAYDYVWFNGAPVAQVDVATSTFHWTFTDHLGTPILQTGASAAIDWRAEHEPFGTVFAFRTGATRRQPLRLPGQEAEQGDDGSLVGQRSYNIFRWYRAAWGRYTQADPIGLDGGDNVYEYAFDDPVSEEDDLGLDASFTHDPDAKCLICYVASESRQYAQSTPACQWAVASVVLNGLANSRAKNPGTPMTLCGYLSSHAGTFQGVSHSTYQDCVNSQCERPATPRDMERTFQNFDHPFPVGPMVSHFANSDPKTRKATTYIQRIKFPACPQFDFGNDKPPAKKGKKK
jgi:RHS repeat-associated protein